MRQVHVIKTSEGHTLIHLDMSQIVADITSESDYVAWIDGSPVTLGKVIGDAFVPENALARVIRDGTHHTKTEVQENFLPHLVSVIDEQCCLGQLAEISHYIGPDQTLFQPGVH